MRGFAAGTPNSRFSNPPFFQTFFPVIKRPGSAIWDQDLPNRMQGSTDQMIRHSQVGIDIKIGLWVMVVGAWPQPKSPVWPGRLKPLPKVDPVCSYP